MAPESGYIIHLFDSGLDDTDKVVGLQAGAADEGAVHVGLVHEVRGVGGLYAAAVLDADPLGKVVVKKLLQETPAKGVGLLGLIGLVSGWFPARTAARLDPVVAMKL